MTTKKNVKKSMKSNYPGPKDFLKAKILDMLIICSTNAQAAKDLGMSTTALANYKRRLIRNGLLKKRDKKSDPDEPTQKGMAFMKKMEGLSNYEKLRKREGVYRAEALMIDAAIIGRNKGKKWNVENLPVVDIGNALMIKEDAVWIPTVEGERVRFSYIIYPKKVIVNIKHPLYECDPDELSHTAMETVKTILFRIERRTNLILDKDLICVSKSEFAHQGNPLARYLVKQYKKHYWKHFRIHNWAGEFILNVDNSDGPELEAHNAKYGVEAMKRINDYMDSLALTHYYLLPHQVYFFVETLLRDQTELQQQLNIIQKTDKHKLEPYFNPKRFRDRPAS